MTEAFRELASRLVVRRRRDGRCEYDLKAKQDLMALCLEPGASIARIAMEHGVNANLVRTWLSKRRLATEVAAEALVADELPPLQGDQLFVPVRLAAPSAGVEAAHSNAKSAPAPRGCASAPTAAPKAMHVQLPNGVQIELEFAAHEDMAPMLQLLVHLPCSR